MHHEQNREVLRMSGTRVPSPGGCGCGKIAPSLVAKFGLAIPKEVVVCRYCRRMDP